MTKIRVRLKDRSYDIRVQAGLRKRLQTLLKPWASKGSPVLILSDANLKRLYPGLFRELHSRNVFFYFIPAGEKSKTLSTVEKITGFMLSHGFDRKSLLVALGGGVVGDLGGFTASIYMRGIPFIQVPTTLLAQVDSSVGGKTGVNHRLGKNMIGAFYQPKVVFIDPEFLKTLSKREFLNGFAEVIKHGIIRDPVLFGFLEKQFKGIMARTPALLERMVAVNCRIKSSVVSADEEEKGLRAILNFGHTFGHAVETLTGYGRYTHGEAVMLGMAAATETALQIRMLPLKTAERIQAYLACAGLPAKPGLKPDRVYQKMFSDKKALAGRLRLVLPGRVGDVSLVVDPPKSAVIAGIRAVVCG